MYYLYIKNNKNDLPIGMLEFDSYEVYTEFKQTWADNVERTLEEYLELRSEARASGGGFMPFEDYLMQSLAMACDSMGAPFRGMWDFRHTENSTLYI